MPYAHYHRDVSIGASILGQVGRRLCRTSDALRADPNIDPTTAAALYDARDALSHAIQMLNVAARAASGTHAFEDPPVEREVWVVLGRGPERVTLCRRGRRRPDPDLFWTETRSPGGVDATVSPAVEDPFQALPADWIDLEPVSAHPRHAFLLEQAAEYFTEHLPREAHRAIVGRWHAALRLAITRWLVAQDGAA